MTQEKVALITAGGSGMGAAAAKKLASMQDASGAFIKAEQSITRSGGVNLHLETTALAVMALLKSESHHPDETRAREVILYFRHLAPGAIHSIPIDLVAQVPGSYEAPASQAYLYYTDDLKTWADPIHVDVTR